MYVKQDDVSNRVFTFDLARSKSRLTQKDVSEKTGIPVSKYNVIERLSYDDLKKIARALNIPEADLFCVNS